MQDFQISRPLSVNTDKSPKFLSETEAFYLLNQERYLNKNGENNGTLGKATPLTANYPLCDIDFPAGENYVIGSYTSEITNELYSFVWNSNGVHFIMRTNGDGKCEIVYHGGCLNLSAEPRHAVKQFRAYLKVERVCANRDGKYLIWTDGRGVPKMIDVEASIATNNFTTDFFKLCADGCEATSMCVPDPCSCITGRYIPTPQSESGLSNNILKTPFKFAYRFVYYDGRASIWSNPSTLFYRGGDNCFDEEKEQSRCIELEVPVGNPLVEKIEIAYSINNIWYKAESVEKYNEYSSPSQKWYERSLSNNLTGFNPDKCTFKYLFCNDKQCQAVDPTEFNRVYNPIPRDAQGFFPIKESLCFYNYVGGSCPFPATEAQKFKIKEECVNAAPCPQEMTTIRVRAVIHNKESNFNQFIYRMEGTGGGDGIKIEAGTKWFGGLRAGGLDTGFNQSFNDKDVQNFIVYVAGTDYSAQMRQYKADAFFQNRTFWGTVNGLVDGVQKRRWEGAIKAGEFFYQEAEIKVPKGTRGFLRLTSHLSNTADQSKSTTVDGLQNLFVYKGDLDTSEGFTANVKEIYFDTAGLDTLEIYNAFRIYDLAKNGESAMYGYITDNNNKAAENLLVKHGTIPEIKAYTDWNGFYFKSLSGSGSHTSDVIGETSVGTQGVIGTITFNHESGFAYQKDKKIDNVPWTDNRYLNVLLKVVDCTGQPVTGITVALSGRRPAKTDNSGEAKFKIRQDLILGRKVRAVIMDRNDCTETDCAGNCISFMYSAERDTPADYVNTVPAVVFPQATINTDPDNTLRKGLKSGGRYPMGFVIRYGCGKISAVNKLPDLVIPKEQEVGTTRFCKYKYDGTGIEFGKDAICVEIVRGENVNPFELQWVADNIEKTTDGKIKITIQSLNDYNEKYLFNTNANYQWMKGDRIEFIRNGDGKLFDVATNGVLNYLTVSPLADTKLTDKDQVPENFFNQILVEDDGRLDKLVKGAIIELQREKPCKTDPVYYSICASLPIDNGRLVYPQGVFETFDTYHIKRKIGEFPALKFEHHSPSDFWGDRQTDTGKPYFVNEFENEKRYGRNFTINTPNEYNRFGDFVRTMETITHGDITAAWVVDDSIGIAISEYDNSVFQVGDNFLNVGSDGIVRASAAEQIISQAQPKLSGQYGCQYDYIGSIMFGDGWVTWWDLNKNTFVRHNFDAAKPADEGKAHNYFSRKSQQILEYNKNQTNPLNKIRISTGINIHTGAVAVTAKALRDSGINNDSAPLTKNNETILYHPIADDFPTFASFTPEEYGYVNMHGRDGCAFVSFLNGIPYIHPIIPTHWNEFFGVPCDWIIGVALNKNPTKIKMAISIEQESDEAFFFAEKIMTDRNGYESEIPPVKFEKSERKWNASFLGNKNSRQGLFGDDFPRGYYVAVTLKRDNTIDKKYSTINNQKRIAFSELGVILFKFVASEQSGFTQNL